MANVRAIEIDGEADGENGKAILRFVFAPNEKGRGLKSFVRFDIETIRCEASDKRIGGTEFAEE